MIMILFNIYVCVCILSIIKVWAYILTKLGYFKVCKATCLIAIKDGILESFEFENKVLIYIVDHWGSWINAL